MENEFSNLKVAFVTDWMLAPGGADRLLFSLIKLFPDSTVFTSIYDESRYNGDFKIPVEVRTSFLQKMPFKFNLHRHYNVLTPIAFENLDLSGFDLVISLSAGPAKGCIVDLNQKHLGIILTPPRYLWDKDANFRASRLRRLYSFITPVISTWLRMWDFSTTKRLDRVVSISEFIKRKVAHYYGMDSEVVYPGLSPDWYILGNSINKMLINSLPEEYFLIVSRLYDYKNVDWGIKAAIKSQKHIVIVGEGPDKSYLKKLAGKSELIHFVGRVPDEDLKYLYANSEALIFAGIEDYGYVPVEAMAQGCPVFALNRGGVTETVVSGKTGELFEDEIDLVKLLQDYKSDMYNKVDIIARSRLFNEEIFHEGIIKQIRKIYER